jgi:hypothetical protein
MNLDLFNDPLALARMATNLEVGTQVFGASSHLMYARQIQQAAAYQSAQLNQAAGQARAASQIEAQDVQRRSDRLASRALAVAAASGGGASDPTVVNTIAGIAQEGAYRKAVALYKGDEEARKLTMQAEATQYEGKSKAFGERMTAVGGFMGAGTSLVKGMAKQASLLEKYGGGGPKLDFTTKKSDSDPWADLGPGE